MNDEKIKQSIKYFTGGTSPHIKTLLDLASAYLAIKGWPENPHDDSLFKSIWQDAENACKLALLKKLEGLEGMIIKVVEDCYLSSGAKKWVLHGSTDMFKKDLAQFIRQHILGGKE